MRRKILLIGVLVGVITLGLGGASALAAGDTKDLDAFTKEAQEAAKKAAEKKAPAKAAPAATAVKAAEPKKEEKKEEEKKPEKWWNLSFGYSISHNIDKNRPNLGNNFFVEPVFNLPYKINLMAHIGLGVSTVYHSMYESDGGQNVTINQVDMEPILISLSRSFKIEPKYTGFAVNVKIDQLIPAVSKYAGLNNGFYYAFKPGVGVSVSRWGLTLANGFGFQVNAHNADYAKHDGDDGGPFYAPLNRFSLSDMTSLRYKFWKMEAGVAAGYIVGWRYNWSRQGNRIGTVKYGADIGIDAMENLNINVSLDTTGPERRNGGFQSDRIYPLHAQFTQFALTIVYSL